MGAQKFLEILWSEQTAVSTAKEGPAFLILWACANWNPIFSTQQLHPPAFPMLSVEKDPPLPWAMHMWFSHSMPSPCTHTTHTCMDTWTFISIHTYMHIHLFDKHLWRPTMWSSSFRHRIDQWIKQTKSLVFVTFIFKGGGLTNKTNRHSQQGNDIMC